VAALKVEAGFEVAAIGAVPTRDQWQTRMFTGPIYAGGLSYSADIYWGAAFLCRLVYAGPAQTPIEAHAALAARALIWIASYQARPGRTRLAWITAEGDPFPSFS
jgi:hypothetical protein